MTKRTERKMEILKGLIDGKEITVIAKEKGCNSAVFWMDNGTVYTWSREIGLIERGEDYTFEDVAEHIVNIEDEGGQAFVRG